MELIFLFLILAGCAVYCEESSNLFIVQVPEDEYDILEISADEYDLSEVPEELENTEKLTEDEYSSRKGDLKIFWNVPTMQCHTKNIYFNDLYKKYGIVQNREDTFRGEKISILYDPGLFPALLKNRSSGEMFYRNGGVPQEGDLDKHLEEFKKTLEESIPDQKFNGVGILDFESWRPVFRQNFGSLEPYKQVSLDIERRRIPGAPSFIIKQWASRRFEKSARLFMEATLKTAKSMRPDALWGYYAYPYCFNMASSNMRESCASGVREENDRISWLWDQSTALYPSIYSSKDLSTNQLRSMIKGRLEEAARLSTNGNIYPYFWYKYRDDGFIVEKDLIAALNTIYKSKASGLIIWGSSNDVNTPEKCKSLYKYVETILGPAVSKYTKKIEKRHTHNRSEEEHKIRRTRRKLEHEAKRQRKQEKKDAHKERKEANREANKRRKEKKKADKQKHKNGQGAENTQLPSKNPNTSEISSSSSEENESISESVKSSSESLEISSEERETESVKIPTTSEISSSNSRETETTLQSVEKSSESEKISSESIETSSESKEMSSEEKETGNTQETIKNPTASETSLSNSEENESVSQSVEISLESLESIETSSESKEISSEETEYVSQSEEISSEPNETSLESIETSSEINSEEMSTDKEENMTYEVSAENIMNMLTSTTTNRKPCSRKPITKTEMVPTKDENMTKESTDSKPETKKPTYYRPDMQMTTTEITNKKPKKSYYTNNMQTEAEETTAEVEIIEVTTATSMKPKKPKPSYKLQDEEITTEAEMIATDAIVTNTEAYTEPNQIRKRHLQNESDDETFTAESSNNELVVIKPEENIDMGNKMINLTETERDSQSEIDVMGDKYPQTMKLVSSFDESAKNSAFSHTVFETYFSTLLTIIIAFIAYI